CLQKCLWEMDNTRTLNTLLYYKSCMFSTSTTIQYIFTELSTKVNESWGWRREKEQIIICKIKIHLGIFVCKLCHAIPNFFFHPSVAQRVCPSQDCILCSCTCINMAFLWVLGFILQYLNCHLLF
uniref:Uncharacterized protein n=1 Tax=Cyanoderma ruficeps TaxID=181631 RepID=A0A8C3QIF8_9PASS